MPQDFSNTLDPNQDARHIEIDGKRFGGGLMMPSARPLTFNPLMSAIRPLSQERIISWIKDPRRSPSSKFFPAGDWIVNQLGIGSCNGWAAAVSLEKSWALLGMGRVKLSGNGLYAMINGGRDQGSMLDSGLQAMTENGVPLRSKVPEIEEYREERISGEAWASMDKHQARECYRLDNEMDVASALASNFMVIVAVHAGRNFMRPDRNGVLGCDDGDGNHAVGLDDIRISEGRLEYRLVNSWGVDWGLGDGTGWVTFQGHLARTIGIHAFYAIRAAKRS